ncbi:MAG: hypothetical protein LBC42_01835, partial [Puniceicoccales bacterium]|nr:hypothetical protein [Puniceicoccales bacterium]
MIELMYDEELKQHLGFNKNEQKAGGRPNYRNGTSKKTVRSCNGPIELYGWLRKAGRVCGKVGWEVPVHQQV